MTDPRAAVIVLTCLGALMLVLPLCAIARRVWWTEFVQERKLRWTGESSYLPYLPFRQDWTPRGRHPSDPVVRRGDRNPLAGGTRPGTRRTTPPVRASTPALLPGSAGPLFAAAVGVADPAAVVVHGRRST